MKPSSGRNIGKNIGVNVGSRKSGKKAHSKTANPNSDVNDAAKLGDSKSGPLAKKSIPDEKLVKATMEQLPMLKEMAQSPKPKSFKIQKKISSVKSQSPPSTIGNRRPPRDQQGTGSQLGTSSLASSVNTDTQSIVGKIRIKTFIVNPDDMPTSRGGSETSRTSRTIGGRRKPSAAEREAQSEAQRNRSKKAIFISTVVSILVLITCLVFGLSLMYGLTEKPTFTSAIAAKPTSTEEISS